MIISRVQRSEMLRVDLTVATFTHFYALLAYSHFFLSTNSAQSAPECSCLFVLKVPEARRSASTCLRYQSYQIRRLSFCSSPPLHPIRLSVLVAAALPLAANLRHYMASVPVAYGNGFLLATGNTSQAIAKSCARNSRTLPA